MIEAAVGDSFGVGFEYVSNEIVEQFGHVLEYRPHPKHTQIQAGSYSDDTQQSVAICEAMLENDPWTKETLAERFVQVFKRDQRTGYSGRFYKILTTVNTGSELLDVIKGDSDRSGAAMRAFPVGLYPDLSEVVEKTITQAEITHSHELGISAAVASALITHYFAYDLGSKSTLGYFLDFFVDTPAEIGKWNDDYVGKVGSKGWMSVKAAITAIKASDSLSELLVKCVSFTGDVDTVATIAMAAASFCHEMKQDIPNQLIENMENGTFGRDYLMSLDWRLQDKFGDVLCQRY